MTYKLIAIVGPDPERAYLIRGTDVTASLKRVHRELHRGNHGSSDFQETWVAAGRPTLTARLIAEYPDEYTCRRAQERMTAKLREAERDYLPGRRAPAAAPRPFTIPLLIPPVPQSHWAV